MDLLHTSTAGLLATGSVAAIASALVTRAYIALARGVGLAAPKDVWHDQPVAHSGGWAICLVVGVAAGALGLYRSPVTGPALLIAGALALFGFVDDRRPLQPNTKLLGQLVGSVALITLAPHAYPFHVVLLMPIACLWLVGQSNAVNLMDNMDGMCPALVGVSALGIAAFQARRGPPELAVLAAVLAGASVGFLVWNRKPARVFLGDTGSLPLGFLLAYAAMYGSWIGAGASISRLALPPLLLAVPLLNTAFVVVTRYDAGVPVSRGLADHANYRLVAHGFTVNQAILFLCVISLGGTLLACVFGAWPWGVWLAITALFALALVYFGVFLSHANVTEMYAKLNVPWRENLAGAYRTQRRRVFEILSDATVASAAYFLAFQLRFDGPLNTAQQSNLVRGVPVVILAATGAQWISGLYRVFWKYIGTVEALAIVRSSVIASAVLYLATRLPFFDDYPRSIYFLFGMLFLMLAMGYRVSVKTMHGWRRARAEKATALGGRRVLIVGAGDAGELALRDLRNGGGGSVCGFLDDDPEKFGLRIHGVPVLGATTILVEMALALQIEEVVVAIPKAPLEKRNWVAQACMDQGIAFREVYQISASIPVLAAPTKPRVVEQR